MRTRHVANGRLPVVVHDRRASEFHLGGFPHDLEHYAMQLVTTSDMSA